MACAGGVVPLLRGAVVTRRCRCGSGSLIALAVAGLAARADCTAYVARHDLERTLRQFSARQARQLATSTQAAPWLAVDASRPASPSRRRAGQRSERAATRRAAALVVGSPLRWRRRARTRPARDLRAAARPRRPLQPVQGAGGLRGHLRGADGALVRAHLAWPGPPRARGPPRCPRHRSLHGRRCRAAGRR